MPAAFSPGNTNTFTTLPPSPAPSLAGAQPTVPVVTPPAEREEATSDLGASASSQDADKDGEKD